MNWNMRKAAVVAVVGLALLSSACGVTREDALEELTSVGYSPESAECIMTSIERQGFGADDLTDPIAPEVDAAIQAGVEECLTSGDLAGLSDNIGTDELRAEVLTQLTASGLDATQAECVLAAVEAEGYDMVDLAQAGLEGQTEGGVIDAMATATLGCLTAG